MNQYVNFNDAIKAANPSARAEQEDPLSALMREYVVAKHEFDSACEAHFNAAQNRVAAEKRLADLSQKVTEVVQHGINDPTIPHAGADPINAAQANSQRCAPRVREGWDG